MRTIPIRLLAPVVLLLLTPLRAAPQEGGGQLPELPAPGADGMVWERARDAAHRAPGRRLVVSVRERRLWWMDGTDTLYTAPVAVGKGTRLAYGSVEWDFSTPRGVRRVLRKETDPVWVPPDWHYVELARDSAWTLVRLRRGVETPLAEGGRLVVRGERIVRVRSDGREEELPPGEEVIFGDTLFVPPYGTANRRVAGELGGYKLDVGDGYMLHGTPYRDSIGRAATHGCIRLADSDLEYLYERVPVGTPVHVY